MPLPARAWSLSGIEPVSTTLTIRPFQPADVTDEYLAWLNDAHHMRFSNQRFGVHTAASALAYLSTFSEDSSSFFAIEERETSELAGTATIYASAHHGTADIGIMVGGPFAGRGIGKEAVASLRAALFVQGFRKVTLGTSSRNAPMLGIARSLGFVPDGIRVRQEIIGGEEADIVHFAAFAPSRNS